MFRRLGAVAVAAVATIAVLPVAPAFAEAASSARLAAGSVVYPGADRSFTIRVTNNEMALVGRSINAIRVNFPVNEAGIRLGSTAGSAPGFSRATSTDLGSTQFNSYQLGSLRPGSSVDITFPATVGAPLAKDLLGDFRVQVSSDDFATSRNATGNLVASVKVLEIVQDGLAPIAPTNADGSKGVTDGSGTAGQTITYATTVRNHARSSLAVQTGLRSSGSDASSPVSLTVPAGATATSQAPVALAEGTSDRAARFTASATAPGATAPEAFDDFTVQAPASLAYDGLQPTRTTSGQGSGRDFTANVAKAGTPGISLERSTLSFGQNSASTAEPTSFGPGTGSGTLTYPFLEIVGADGALAASVTSEVLDDNLHSYAVSVGLGDVVIDNLAPVIDFAVSLPKDRDGDQQTAVKDGDRISVSGSISNAADLASDSLQVVLMPDAGDAVRVPVTVTGSGDGRTFTGSVTHDWDEAARAFVARASAQDTAGNTGDLQLEEPVTIDNVAPVLTGPGVVRERNRVVVFFDDLTGVAGGCSPNAWRVDGQLRSVREVRTADGAPCTETGAGGRQLILAQSLGVDDTPEVSYDGAALLASRPAKDGAGNVAPAQTIKTVTDLVPVAPRIVSVERRGGTPDAEFETAFQDVEGFAYYTNVSGAEALQLTVGGVRPGWRVEVLRDGAVVAARLFEQPLTGGQSEYDGSVLVPLQAGDGAKDFAVRLRSANGNAGPTKGFTVVLDTVAPALGASTIDGETVTVGFSEKIVTGADVADNWFVGETVETEDGTAVRRVNVNSVTGGDLFSRTFDVTLTDATAFTGTDFLLQRRGSHRYEDRAGNQLADTLLRQ